MNLLSLETASHFLDAPPPAGNEWIPCASGGVVMILAGIVLIAALRKRFLQEDIALRRELQTRNPNVRII